MTDREIADMKATDAMEESRKPDKARIDKLKLELVEYHRIKATEEIVKMFKSGIMDGEEATKAYCALYEDKALEEEDGSS